MNLSNKPFFMLIGRMFSDSAVGDDHCCGTPAGTDACCGSTVRDDCASASSCCTAETDAHPIKPSSAATGGCGCK